MIFKIEESKESREKSQKDKRKYNYMRIKITNHYLLRKQNYNLLNNCFSSLIIIFNTNKN